MTAVRGKLRRLVVRRAENRCEYCGLSQDGQEATFHVDHIVPETADGKTEAENLALACVSCSLYKGARMRGVDPESGAEVPLYNPRAHDWRRHFVWDGVHIVGRTRIGRATIAVLRMNRPLILAIRMEEAERRPQAPAADSAGREL